MAITHVVIFHFKCNFCGIKTYAQTVAFCTPDFYQYSLVDGHIRYELKLGFFTLEDVVVAVTYNIIHVVILLVVCHGGVQQTEVKLSAKTGLIKEKGFS